MSVQNEWSLWYNEAMFISKMLKETKNDLCRDISWR